MKKISLIAWALALSVTAGTGLQGTWESFGLKDGAYVPLKPYELDGGAFRGFAWKGSTYPMMVQNTTDAERRTPPVLNVTVPPRGWVLHPGVREPVVARFTPAEDAVRDVRLELCDLLGGGSGATAGVDVTLKIGGKVAGKATVSAERGMPRKEILIEELSVKKGVPFEIVVDSRGAHACDGTGVKLSFVENRDEQIVVPGDWKRLPPKDVDPKLADRENPVPRPWTGQKAALRFSRVVKVAGGVQVRWNVPPEDAERKLRGSPSPALYRGYGPPRAGVSTPKVYTLGKGFRFFDEPVPDTEVLLPFTVIVDGNDEDGYGGYVVVLDTAANWTLDRAASKVTLTSTDPAARPVVMRFDGTWLAGLQMLCERLAEVPALAAQMKARHGELVKGVDNAPDLALLLTAISEWIQDDNRWNCSADGWDAYLRGRIARRSKLLSDPRLRETLEKGVVFGTRASTAWNHCVAQYYGWRQRPGGDILVLRNPGRTLETDNLTAGKFPQGSFLEPRLSYDARRLLFAFVETDGAVNPRVLKRNENDGDWRYFHLWTMNADGSDPRQITSGVYDDMMGEWLPDGDIVFVSTRRRAHARCFWWGYSERWHSYTLFRAGIDGGNMRQLSWNDVSEWHPTIGNDGLVYFARWDYIDRHAVLHQNLWSMRPDGTNPTGVWGNETAAPHCTFQPRMLPGSGKIAVIASAHHAETGGPLLVIDPSVHDNSEAAVTHVTPGHYPEAQSGSESGQPGFSGDDWYNSPWPYGEDLFMVAWSRDPLHYEPSRPSPDASLGLYVLAADGTREVIYRDGQLNAYAPQPFAARKKPPVWQSQLDASLAARNLAEVFIADVYTGIPKAERGSIKAVRLVQVFPKTTVDTNSPFIGGGGEENARMVLGTATVEPDGSARFLVPACKPFYFQVLDKDGFAWRTMRTSTSAMPGEHVSCVGCHEEKRGAYGSAPKPGSMALKREAERLRATSECGRPWGFVENVQPIFDAKCISCHSGAGAKGGIVLTREIDPRFKGQFTKSFATLCFADDAKGAPHSAKRRFAKNGKEMVANYKQRDNVQTTPEGPGVNALGSGLIAHLRTGEHAKRVTAEELRLIGTWIDLNATFYGCYEEPCLSAQREGKKIPLPERQ